MYVPVSLGANPGFNYPIHHGGCSQREVSLHSTKKGPYRGAATKSTSLILSLPNTNSLLSSTVNVRNSVY